MPYASKDIKLVHSFSIFVDCIASQTDLNYLIAKQCSLAPCTKFELYMGQHFLLNRGLKKSFYMPLCVTSIVQNEISIVPMASWNGDALMDTLPFAFLTWSAYFWSLKIACLSYYSIRFLIHSTSL